MKVDADFVKHSFSGNETVKEYSKATIEIGLWKSEKIIFNKYLERDDFIIDIGCGAGRITYSLHKEGYKNIIGLDVSEEMIEKARILYKDKFIPEFVVGDALKLEFADEAFDKAIFGFNGIMQIPGSKNRMKAFYEINRILKKDGIFIFTSHDRNKSMENNNYWQEEKILWEKGIQNKKLLDFGDLIYTSYDREMFIHIPTKDEVKKCLYESNFTLVEDFFRDEVVEETEKVKRFSDECRFYVAKKRS